VWYFLLSSRADTPERYSLIIVFLNSGVFFGIIPFDFVILFELVDQS